MKRGLKPYADERLVLIDQSVGCQRILCWRDPYFFFSFSHLNRPRGTINYYLSPNKLGSVLARKHQLKLQWCTVYDLE